MPQSLKRKFTFAILLLVLAGTGYWLLITPDNPFTRMVRGRFSDFSARVAMGPYPVEDDFRVLSKARFTTIVSLLYARLVYEGTLLQRERALAHAYNMRFINIPMSSILGRSLDNDYADQAGKAAEAILHEPGKVYVHCYLGLHRAKSVAGQIEARGVRVSTYGTPNTGLSQDARLYYDAQREFQQQRYQAALDTLSQVKHPDSRVHVLRGWTLYRQGKFSQARSIFMTVLETSAQDAEAHTGAGYCALRQNDWTGAERGFTAALHSSPQSAAALVGMGLLRYRRGKIKEAADFLQAGLLSDSNNDEARAVLAKIRPKLLPGD